MIQTTVILVRVVLGLLIGCAGIVAFSKGLMMTAHEDFAVFSPLALAMIAGMAIGFVLLFWAWRLLSTTLRIHSR